MVSPTDWKSQPLPHPLPQFNVDRASRVILESDHVRSLPKLTNAEQSQCSEWPTRLYTISLSPREEKSYVKKVTKQKKPHLFYYRKSWVFSPDLSGKEEKINYLHQNVLLWHRKITKYSVIFHPFYRCFFCLYHLLCSFLQTHVHLDVGVGDNLVERHIGACVSASSLVLDNILRY